MEMEFVLWRLSQNQSDDSLTVAVQASGGTNSGGNAWNGGLEGELRSLKISNTSQITGCRDERTRLNQVFMRRMFPTYYVYL